MKVLNYFLGIAGVSTSVCMNKMKYIWMNKADSVFAKEGSPIEVPYGKTLFSRSLNVKSMIPRSYGIWMNYMKDSMWYIYAICHVICLRCYVMCAVWYVWWCMLLSWNDFPNQICQVHWLSKSKFGRSTNFRIPNLPSLLTWLSINHIVRKYLLLLMHVLGVCLHKPIISTCV